jgi:hypothetical protein
MQPLIDAGELFAWEFNFNILPYVVYRCSPVAGWTYRLRYEGVPGNRLIKARPEFQKKHEIN